jgi:L-ascorbate metabolism protein UlaG (beta-lactamase superfamily)
MPNASWRTPADWAKKRPTALRIADFLGRGRGRFRVLDRVKPPQPADMMPDLTRWAEHDLAAIWIGHATILVRLAGMTILTDPVFSNRVGLGLGLMTGGPRRLVAPALSIRQLPPIDLLLISHAHFDHLDRPTLSRLPKQTAVVTAHHTADLISDLGFASVTELRWGESTNVGPLKITAQEVVHWGARTFYDQHRGFNAYLLEGANRRVLYGGDSAYHEGFKSIGEVGKVDLAAIGIGAYNPYLRAHANPEQAWAMGEFARAEHLLPMHHSTFRLSHEPVGEPMERLLTAAGSSVDRVAIRQIGGMWVGPN